MHHCGHQCAQKEAEALTDEQLMEHARKLPNRFWKLVVPMPKDDSSMTPSKYVQQWNSSALGLRNKTLRSDPLRFQVLQALAKDQLHRDDFSGNLCQSVKEVVRRAMKYGSPDKLNAWLAAGGRKCRMNATVLQSRRETLSDRKKIGDLLAVGKRAKRQRSQ